MLCDQVREHLSAYLDKELTADLSAAVRAHLDSCADCRALADDLRATMNLLGRLPARPAPGHLADDVMRAIERRGILALGAPVEPQLQERMLPVHRASAWPRALAVAATVVLAIGIGIFAYLSDIGRKAAPMPDSGVARKAADASKSYSDLSIAMLPAPKAAPSDAYKDQESTPLKKAAEKRSENRYLSVADAKKESEGGKSEAQWLEEHPEAPSPGYSFVARGSDAPAKESAHAVTLAKANDGAMVTLSGGNLTVSNGALGRNLGTAGDVGLARLDINGTLSLSGANTYTGGVSTRLNRSRAFGYYEEGAGQPISFYDGTEMTTGVQLVQSPTVLMSSLLAASPGGANGLSYFYDVPPAAPGRGGRFDLDGDSITLSGGTVLKGEVVSKPGAGAFYGGALVMPKAEEKPAVEVKVAAGSEKMPAVELWDKGGTAALVAPPPPAAMPSAPPIVERAKPGDLALAGRGMPSKPDLTSLDATMVERPAAAAVAPSAPLAQNETVSVGGAVQAGMLRANAATRRAGEHRARPLLERTMLEAAEGEVGVEQLSRAASGEALLEAGNQLVLRVESPDQADRSLVELFKAAGWRPLAVDRDRSALKQTMAENDREGAVDGPSAKAGNYEVRKLVPGGVYYRATRNGEDVWLVLADRDSLSRFGSRLAQAQGLTVSAGSSADFLAIRGLQRQFVESQVAKASTSDKRFSSGKDFGTDNLATLDKATLPEGAASAPPAPPASATPAPALGDQRREKLAQNAPAASAGATAVAPTTSPAALQQVVKGDQSGAAVPEQVVTAAHASTSYGTGEKAAGGRYGGEGGGGGGGGGNAAAKSDFNVLKAKQEMKQQAKGPGAPAEAEATAAAATDRILLVIRVQPVEASRAGVAPADSKSVEKTKP